MFMTNLARRISSVSCIFKAICFSNRKFKYYDYWNELCCEIFHLKIIISYYYLIFLVCHKSLQLNVEASSWKCQKSISLEREEGDTCMNSFRHRQGKCTMETACTSVTRAAGEAAVARVSFNAGTMLGRTMYSVTDSAITSCGKQPGR